MPNIIRARCGRLVEPDMQVRIQHCVGRYGQTRITSGAVREVRPDLQCLILDTADGINTIGVPLDGYHRHDDFEHGHETWTEILDTTGTPA